MANKVCCEETSVTQTIDMNDRDYLDDILCTEKEKYCRAGAVTRVMGAADMSV